MRAVCDGGPLSGQSDLDSVPDFNDWFRRTADTSCDQHGAFVTDLIGAALGATGVPGFSMVAMKIS